MANCLFHLINLWTHCAHRNFLQLLFGKYFWGQFGIQFIKNVNLLQKVQKHWETKFLRYIYPIGVVHKPSGHFFDFLTPPPFVDHLWIFGKLPSPCLVHMVYKWPIYSLFYWRVYLRENIPEMMHFHAKKLDSFYPKYDSTLKHAWLGLRYSNTR